VVKNLTRKIRVYSCPFAVKNLIQIRDHPRHPRLCHAVALSLLAVSRLDELEAPRASRGALSLSKRLRAKAGQIRDGN
jgi:hypothetical protein